MTVDRRARLAERRKVQAEALRAKREAMQERLAERRKDRPRSSQTGRAVTAGLALAVIVLLLLRTCGGDPGDEVDYLAGPPWMPEPGAAIEPGASGPTGPPVRFDRRDRPELVTVPPAPPTWLVAFRLQVSARSPRLAECFVGAARPGRLHWTATVEPNSGAIGTQTIEPQLRTSSLTAREMDCVTEVLGSPPYRLPVELVDSTPKRVSLVLEF